MKTVLCLPDGQELTSGAPGTAILSSTLTHCVNAETDLKPGSCCAAMAELTVFHGGEFAPGQEITVFLEQEDGQRQQEGIFILEKPEKTGYDTQRLTAYDRVVLLDQDLTDWLAGLTDWPYSLYDFCRMVCEECGLELANETLPNGSFPVQKFSSQGITGRQLICWVGEAAGLYAHANTQGQLEFAWYTQAQTEVWPNDQRQSAVCLDGVLELSGVSAALESATLTLGGVRAEVHNETLTLCWIPNQWYFQNGLTVQDYQVQPVQKVQICATDSDVGVIWPEEPEGTNTYRVEGNLLLSAQSTQDLLPVAQVLFEQLQGICYTPCQVTVPDTANITAGQILTIGDLSGKTVSAYVMTARRCGGQLTLSCTGNSRRDSVTAVNTQSYKALSGKVLELQTSLEGLRAENRDAAGNLARVELDLEGVRSQVEKHAVETQDVSTRVSALEQSAEALQLEFTQILEEGVEQVKTTTGFTFNDQGLHIQKSGEAIANRMDHTGMYVTRSDTEILVANTDGVQATDLTAHNFLIVGSHARFQDYGENRTGCFYLS